MVKVLGQKAPRIQQALLELAFSRQTIETAEQSENIRLLDAGIRAATLTREQRHLLLKLSKPAIFGQMSESSQAAIQRFHKRTLFRNALALTQLYRLELALYECGYEQMIGLKGLAAIAHAGGDVGSRYMSDVDVLIPNLQKRPEEALRIFESLGLTRDGSNFRSITLRLARELKFDLHWYLHDWALDPCLVDLAREQSVTKTVCGVGVRVLCLEHHLAHTISHGIFSVNEINSRWVFDVLTALQCTELVDVDRFCEYANRLAAPKSVGDALIALTRELPAEIEIDRSVLMEMAGRIKPKSRLIYWLHNRSLVISDSAQGKVRPSSLSFIKQILNSFVYLPWVARRNGQSTYWQYWGWRQSFPPPPVWVCVRNFGRELWHRGPLKLMSVLLRRTRASHSHK